MFQKTITNSSNVTAIAYDEGKKTLFVDFKTGAKYAYMNVGIDIWDQITKVESVGQFVKNVLTKEFFYKQVNK